MGAKTSRFWRWLWLALPLVGVIMVLAVARGDLEAAAPWAAKAHALLKDDRGVTPARLARLDRVARGIAP